MAQGPREDRPYRTDVRRDGKDRTKWRWRVVFSDPQEGQETGGGYLTEAAARADLAFFLKRWAQAQRHKEREATKTVEQLLYGE